MDRPQDLCQDDHGFQHGRVLCVQKPGKNGGGDGGQPPDQTKRIKTGGQGYLNRDKKELQRNGKLSLQTDIVPDDGDHVGDKAGDTAQDKAPGAHDQTLERLHTKNISSGTDEAAADHHGGPKECNDISNEYYIHINDPIFVKACDEV